MMDNSSTFPFRWRMMDKAPRWNKGKEMQRGLLSAWSLRLSQVLQGHSQLVNQQSQGQNSQWSGHRPAGPLTSRRPFGCGPSRHSSPPWSWCASRTSRAPAGRRWSGTWLSPHWPLPSRWAFVTRWWGALSPAQVEDGEEERVTCRAPYLFSNNSKQKHFTIRGKQTLLPWHPHLVIDAVSI